MGTDPKAQVLAAPSSATLRAELEALVLADLLGAAGGPEEEVDEPRVSDRYCIGMLAPRRLKAEAGGNDEVGAGTEGAIEPWSSDNEQPEVTVQGVARRRGEEWVVTLFLVNGQTERERLKDEVWIFQPELRVDAPNEAPIFLQRPLVRDPERMDPAVYAEEIEMAMLYRRHLEFATGHGVAVHADTSPEAPWPAVSLYTHVAPSFNVPQQTPSL